MRASPIPSSRQPAEAGSWIGIAAVKPSVQATNPEVGNIEVNPETLAEQSLFCRAPAFGGFSVAVAGRRTSGRQAWQKRTSAWRSKLRGRALY